MSLELLPFPEQMSFPICTFACPLAEINGPYVKREIGNNDFAVILPWSFFHSSELALQLQFIWTKGWHVSLLP